MNMKERINGKNETNQPQLKSKLIVHEGQCIAGSSSIATARIH